MPMDADAREPRSLYSAVVKEWKEHINSKQRQFETTE